MWCMASRRYPPEGWHTRPRTGWFFLALVLLVTVPTAVGAVVSAQPQALAVIATSATVTYVAWAFFLRPILHVEDHAITIVNPLRRHVIPWSAITDVDTRFNLTVVTEDGRYPSYAAPSPGGRAALRARPEVDPSKRRAAAHLPSADRPGDQLSTASGAAAQIIRGHWRDLRERGELGEPAPVVSTVERHVLATGSVLALIAAIAWLVP